MSDEEDRHARKRELARLRSKKYRENKKLEEINKRRFVKYTSSALDRPECSRGVIQNLNDSHCQFNELNAKDEHHDIKMESEVIYLNMDCFDMIESDLESPNKNCSDTLSCSSGDENEDQDKIEELELDIREASIDEDELEDCLETEEMNEIEELRQWALSGNPTIPHTRINSLLAILRKRLLPELPKNAKTFLDTSKAHYHLQQFDLNDGSEFVYFGMTKYLQSVINPNFHRDGIIHLILNVDGLQIFRSSSRQFWPILCKIHSNSEVYEPFPVAIYSGKNKPSDLEQYLNNFIDEINQLQNEGISVDNHLLQVRIKAFICDTPARAFLKCIKGHGGYWACERCTVRGERLERRTIYPNEDCQARTDTSFRQQSNPEHHTGNSPLLSIEPPINMITEFLLDFMHLVCLGVMKKLLEYWLYGTSIMKISHNAKSQLSNLLIRLQSQIPVEFQRTTRTLTEFERFKAVEFKFLLLYAGPIVFKRVLNDAAYKHFLFLHAACRILCSKKLALINYENAKKLLEQFVKTSEKLYGKTSLIGNMHNLIHLADDVKNMECPLSNVTAFPFENCLGKIKKLLRSGNRPLAQICRRLQEIYLIDIKNLFLLLLYKLYQNYRRIFLAIQ